MAIIGEELPSYVITQINLRQDLHGSGVNTTLRDPNQLNVLNSTTSWIKLASGVSVTDGSRLSKIGFNQTQVEQNLRLGLAKNNILFGGTAKLTDVEGRKFDKLQQRSGFLPRDAESSYTYGSYGFSPMPGIESADIKTLNRGSIKKATVKLKANNRQQFEILDLLYMRLGYTVLLEWGNSLYIDNKRKSKTVLRNTLVEEFFFQTESNTSYFPLLNRIENKRSIYSGNYDGIVGKVSNFNWTFNIDGSYDIELTIISLGDVIESLKLNLSIDRDTLGFLNSTGNLTPSTNPEESPSSPDVLEENKSANMITSMLYVWKYLNNGEYRGNLINILANKKKYSIGSFLVPTQEGGDSQEIATTSVEVIFTINYFVKLDIDLPSEYKAQAGEVKTVDATSVAPVKETEKKSFTAEQWNNGKKDINSYKKSLIEKYEKIGSSVKVTYKKGKGTITRIENPIAEAGTKDACRVNSSPRQFYLRFGYLLEYIKENVLPRIKVGETHDDNPSIFDIDYDEWNTHMYSLPNQISLDPRVCIVRNSNFNSGKGITEVFPELPFFREVDNGESTNENAAYPLNIYLNFEFILECLKADEKGNVSIFEFISSICTGLNKALGGINNLEPVIDETTNTLQIIDTTPIPKYSSNTTDSYTLQIYGYDKNGQNYISNFVRNIDLKTAITPEFATMITVGATAGGYVKGTEATAFSKWNVGLRDRFKEELVPGVESSVPQANKQNEAAENYETEFLANGYVTRYGLTSLTGNFKLNQDAIERNLSIVTEFYKYIISKKSETQTSSGGIVGFIPFKLNLTLDGISGIKIYNKLEVNTEFLPKVYGETVDLIVTGVSHNLSNNDWTTQIETTLIPKVGGQIAKVIDAEFVKEVIADTKGPDKISSCKGLPAAAGLSSSVKGLIKASTTKDSTLVQAIVDYLEGGYYHPVHAYDSKTKTLKSSYSIYKNSGETLYGIDRYAGNTEGLRQGPKDATGIEFWAAVDAISGYGKYGNAARYYKTKNWKIKEYPPIKTAWNHYDKPKKSDKGYDTLQKNLQKYITSQYKSFFKSYFGNHPVGKLVENDGRLKFMYYRATWNGVGFFQNYANNLKLVYDSGVTDINKLICADLTYRYNTKSSDFKPGVSKMSFMMDYEKPNS
jgi:hypothetical protein